MKKIIALFVMMLACGVTANAQQKDAAAPKTPGKEAVAQQAAFEDAAIKDLNALSQLISLTNEQKVNIKSLFVYKHSKKAENISDERKKVLLNGVEAKLKSSLTKDQLAKLEQSPKLIETLTH